MNKVRCVGINVVVNKDIIFLVNILPYGYIRIINIGREEDINFIS